MKKTVSERQIKELQSLATQLCTLLADKLVVEALSLALLDDFNGDRGRAENWIAITANRLDRLARRAPKMGRLNADRKPQAL